MMPVSEYNQIIAANFLAAYTWFQRHNPNYLLKSIGDFLCACTPGTNSWERLSDFNVAMPGLNMKDAPLARDFHENCTLIKDFFASHNSPFSLWFMGFSNTFPHADAPKAQDIGFDTRASYTGQYLDLKTLRQSNHNNLRIKRVDNKKELENFSDLVALGWNMPNSLYRNFFAAQPDFLLKATAEKHFYLGLFENNPVCCMELFLQPKEMVVGIYYVSTHPDYRHRGFASALQAQVLSLARDKAYKYAISISEPDECRLLTRLGFINCLPWYEYGLMVNPL